MHRLGAGLAAGLDDAVDGEIALRRRRRPDAHRLVRLAHMPGVGIGLGIDRHGLDAHGARRADHPAGDLPAIGYEDLREHRLLVPLRRYQCCCLEPQSHRATEFHREEIIHRIIRLIPSLSSAT
jgi:hypothetical protein